jgi:hypothetical protein
MLDSAGMNRCNLSIPKRVISQEMAGVNDIDLTMFDINNVNTIQLETT